MFTLGHFHGTMLALVNIAAGLTIRNVDGFKLRPSVSFSLIWAAILLPGGFLLGSFWTYDGDPGTGVWLVPIGALLMLYWRCRFRTRLSSKRRSNSAATRQALNAYLLLAVRAHSACSSKFAFPDPLSIISARLAAER